MGEIQILSEVYLTIEELAARKGVSVPWIRKAKSNLGLPYYKFGRILKFRESEFDLWASQRRVN